MIHQRALLREVVRGVGAWPEVLRRGGGCGCDRRQDDAREQGHVPRQQPTRHRPRMEREERDVPRAVQDRRQEQRDNGHTATDRDARRRGECRHHRRDGDAEGHSGEDSRGGGGLHTDRQRQPGNPTGGRGGDVQLRDSRSRGQGLGKGARVDRGAPVPGFRA